MTTDGTRRNNGVKVEVPVQLEHQADSQPNVNPVVTETDQVGTDVLGHQTMRGEGSSQSIFERGWHHITTFFNAAGASLCEFFRNIFSSLNKPAEKPAEPAVIHPNIAKVKKAFESKVHGQNDTSQTLNFPNDDQLKDPVVSLASAELQTTEPGKPAVEDENIILPSDNEDDEPLLLSDGESDEGPDLFGMSHEDEKETTISESKGSEQTSFVKSALLVQLNEIEKKLLTYQSILPVFHIHDESDIHDFVQIVNGIEEAERILINIMQPMTAMDPTNISKDIDLVFDESEKNHGLIKILRDNLNEKVESYRGLLSDFKELCYLVPGKEDTGNLLVVLLSRYCQTQSKTVNQLPNLSVESSFKAPKNLVPRGIPVEGPNACYRNAANQALCACEQLRALIRESVVELENKEWFELDKKEKIKKALNLLIVSLELNCSDEIVQKADSRLKYALFTSGLNRIEFTLEKINRQQDTRAYLELILSQVFNYQRFEQTTNSIVRDGKTLSIPKTAESGSALVNVPLPKVDLKNGSNQVIQFQDIVDAVYSPIKQEDDFRYQGERHIGFTEKVKIVTDPQDVIMISLKREETDFETKVTIVNQTEVNMPPKGVLDFSLAHEFPKGTLLYDVKSFIHHKAATADAGHYLSYVKKEGQWYCCEDKDVHPVKTETAASAMRKGSVFFFEKQK